MFFRGKIAKFQTHLCSCRAFSLLCHSNSFHIIANMASGFPLVTPLGMERNQCCLMLFQPQPPVFMIGFVSRLRYVFLCSQCFVEIDTFLKLYGLVFARPSGSTR